MGSRLNLRQAAAVHALIGTGLKQEDLREVTFRDLLPPAVAADWTDNELDIIPLPTV